jgi:hypothetical protein
MRGRAQLGATCFSLRGLPRPQTRSGPEFAYPAGWGDNPDEMELQWPFITS